jgi:hypothetical protein
VKGGQGNSLFRWDALLLKKVRHSIESLCRVRPQIARKSHLYSFYIRKTNCGVTLSPSIEAVEEIYLQSSLLTHLIAGTPEQSYTTLIILVVQCAQGVASSLID